MVKGWRFTRSAYRCNTIGALLCVPIDQFFQGDIINFAILEWGNDRHRYASKLFALGLCHLLLLALSSKETNGSCAIVYHGKPPCRNYSCSITGMSFAIMYPMILRRNGMSLNRNLMSNKHDKKTKRSIL